MPKQRVATISLCLVVKDEELFLRECLESALPHLDEAVVVDTGSGDRTVAIARAMGARVFESPWPGDLARAHDLPLEHARGDWALILDGDEALDPIRGAELHDLVRDTRHSGFHFTVRNYRFLPGHQHRPVTSTDPRVHGARSWTPSGAVRLFRNRPEYRHEGRVHQSVLPSIQRAGASVSSTTIPIHHYGFLRTDRVKSPLYTALAEQQARDRPADPKAWLELAMVHLTSGELDAALASCARARDLGNLAESGFFAGIALLEKGDPQGAVAALIGAAEAAACLRYFADEADIWQSLGEAQASLGDEPAAEQAFRACLRLRPDSPEAEGRLVAVLASRGRFEEAAQGARRLTDRYPGLAIGWEATGYQALLAGLPGPAIDAFRRALDVEPERWSSRYNLALAHAHRGEEAHAGTILARALESDRGGRLARMLADVPARPARTGRTPALGPRGVMSVIPHLCGGAAYVATELARALAPAHAQLIATLDSGDFTGESHRQELAALDVPVVTVRNAEDMAALQRRADPAVVVHHWWHSPLLGAITRQGRERLVLRSASPLPMPAGYDRYVTLSAFQEQYQGHIPPGKRERIPNGVDLDRISGAAPHEELWSGFERRGESAVRIAMASRLDPDKFVRRLTDYLAPLRTLPVMVAIAGRGARRWEIEPELVERGLAGWVRFLGPLSQGDVFGFLAAADIGLHLTESHQESHSLTVLQMMAAGLPVVAQPRGCLREMVSSGKTGFLAASEAEVADALRALVEDPARRARLGRAARRDIEPYGTRHFAQRWRDLVARLLSS